MAKRSKTPAADGDLKDEWNTPLYVFEALDADLELDPCAPTSGSHVPATRSYTKAEDGLAQPWSGSVFMNPPFGKRFGQVPWLKRFIEHGNGIGIIMAPTSAVWWQDHVPQVDGLLFPRGKIKFEPSKRLERHLRAKARAADKEWVQQPPHNAAALIAMGKKWCRVLKRSNLGWYLGAVEGWRPK